MLGIFIDNAHRSETEFILVHGSNINVHLYDTGGFVTFNFQISQSFFVSLKCSIISLNFESSIDLNLFLLMIAFMRPLNQFSLYWYRNFSVPTSYELGMDGYVLSG